MVNNTKIQSEFAIPISPLQDHEAHWVDIGENIGRVEGPGHRVALAALAESALRLADQTKKHAQVTSEIFEAATTDQLTGLPNELALKNALVDYEARSIAKGSTLFIALIDLDHLKKVNDTAGHTVGDEYLKVAASAINRSKRQTDKAFRIGGDEFVVIYEGSESDDPAELQEALRQRMPNEINLAMYGSESLTNAAEVYGFSLGASAGLTKWDPRIQSFDEAKHTADEQMFEHKVAMHAERR